MDDDGDCDASISAAAAAVTHVQSPNQEVGSGNEALGLFGFDLSSAETDPWWLEEEQEKEKPKQTRRAYPRPEYMTSTWGQRLQKLSAAQDGLVPACREARDFPSHFKVLCDIFLFIIEAVKRFFCIYMYRRRRGRSNPGKRSTLFQYVNVNTLSLRRYPASCAAAATTA